ncbi:MAG: DUF4118 domain-containing protein [Anaerolineae bacterium]|nr:DUF4118 domain-containing protein [Anaerolineae bacterium]
MELAEKVWRQAYPLVLLTAVTSICWLLRENLTFANFTMIYILLILLLAIQRGTWVALYISFISFLCLNFFLVQPYYTFLVADTREVLDLVVFLLGAAIVGQLAARARQQTRIARQRAYEQEMLYRLTGAFNQLTTSEGVSAALMKVLAADFGARQASILAGSEQPSESDETVQYLPLQAEGKRYGTLRLVFDSPPTAEKRRLLNTCTSQAAMALDRIELAEQARKSHQFEEADRLKTAILHSVSHDLRTPITIIKTSANNLRSISDQLSAPERIELTETIEHEADQLNRLVGNLLDMSRLQAGALTLHLEANSVEEIVGDVAATLYQRLNKQRLHLDFPDDLPLVSCDYVLMRQVFSNLIENALRYEPEDRQIELRASANADHLEVLIINHGEPIPVNERERIMEPFYHGAKGQIGLGLPIAKGIIEAHQGKLRVEDTPGGGATFIIALPLAKESSYVN